MEIPLSGFYVDSWAFVVQRTHRSTNQLAIQLTNSLKVTVVRISRSIACLSTP